MWYHKLTAAILAVYILLITHVSASIAYAPTVTKEANTQMYSGEMQGPCPPFKKDALHRYTGGIQCAKRLDGQQGGQCVAFVQYLLGQSPGFNGNAGEIDPNSDHPEVGQIVLLSGDKWEHVAVIIAMDDDTLTLMESNWNGKEKITIGRQIDITNPQIRGYYHYRTMLE